MKDTEALLTVSLPLGRLKDKKGRPYSDELDRQLFAMLSTGASAESVREHLQSNRAFVLPGLVFELPGIDYFLKK